MKSERFLLIAGFACISILWGSTWSAIKIGLENVPPFFAVAIRFTLALAILAMIMLLRRERLPLNKHSVVLFCTLGVLTFSVPFALLYWAEQYIASGLASILFAVYPFVVAVVSHFLLPKERMTGYKAAGIVLGFAGILIIFWEDIHVGSASSLGMGAVIVCTLLQGSSLVITKKFGKDISPVALNAGGMVVGIIIMYCVAFAAEDFSAIHFDIRGIGSILYLGTFGTVVTFVVYYWLLKRVEAVYLSLSSFVIPVLAVIIGAAVLGEKLETHVFSGAALVLTGILVANGRDLSRVVGGRQEKQTSETFPKGEE